jgi:PTS system mannose-specific IIA component
VIVAHGGLAKEYLAAVEHVVGRQVGMASVAIEAEHTGAKNRIRFVPLLMRLTQAMVL